MNKLIVISGGICKSLETRYQRYIPQVGYNVYRTSQSQTSKKKRKKENGIHNILNQY